MKELSISNNLLGGIFISFVFGGKHDDAMEITAKIDFRLLT